MAAEGISFEGGKVKFNTVGARNGKIGGLSCINSN